MLSHIRSASICLGLWLVAAPAFATLIDALDMAQLVSEADHAVVATVLGQNTHWDDRGRIVTDVTFRVDESMKGPKRPGDELVVRVLGGAIGDLGMRIEGEPSFEDGQRTVLMATDSINGPYCRPVGMSQGVLPIGRSDSGEELVYPGGAGLALVQRGQGGNLLSAPGAMMYPRPVADVVAEIRALGSGRPPTIPDDSPGGVTEDQSVGRGR